MAFHVCYCFQKVIENNLFIGNGKPCQSLKKLYEHVFIETQVYTMLHYTIFQPDWSMLLHTHRVTSTVNMVVCYFTTFCKSTTSCGIWIYNSPMSKVLPTCYHRNKCTMLCSKLLHLQVHLLSSEPLHDCQIAMVHNISPCSHQSVHPHSQNMENIKL